MPEPVSTTPAPRKRRRWLRILGWVLGVFVILTIALYFTATSSLFFKGVILPKASAALNAHITVADASISPFHQVVLRDLKVQTTGTEPLLTAPEVRLQYSLMDIIHGNIHVDEVALTSPTINVVQNPDGSSNLDPLLKSQPSPKPAQPTPANSKPMQIDIGKVNFSDCTLRQVKNYNATDRDVTEISHLNLAVGNVRNGQTGKMTIGADLLMDNRPPAPATHGSVQAKLDGNFSFTLSADLKPAAVEGNTRLQVSRADGSLGQLASMGVTLDCNATPTEIKQIALKFQRADATLAQLLVFGPFNMEKTEGRLTVQLLNVDKNLLNLAGASSGVDFGPTTVNSTNEVTLANGGKLITTVGQFNLDHLQLTRTNLTTPPLDLHAGYDVQVDQAASNALLRAFTLTGSQKGSEIVHGDLAKPMSLSWGNTGNMVGDSTLELAVTHFDFANWQVFLGQVAPAGELNAKLQLVSEQAGKALTFNLTSSLNQLAVISGTNRLDNLAISLTLRGKAADLKQFTFPEYKLDVAQLNHPLVNASGSGTYDKSTSRADVQLTAHLLLANLLQSFPQPSMRVSSGAADLTLHVVQSPISTNESAQAVTGKFALTDFTGQFGSNVFRQFATTADLDVKATPQEVQIQKIAGTLGEGGQQGGSFELSGTYGLSNHAANITAKLTDLNQNGLGPFLQPMLGDKQLVSVALNANASAQYAPQAPSAVKASLLVTNLVVHDPTGQFPSAPLAAGLDLDASLNNQVADLRQLQLALTPTALATNKILVTGHVDMSDTNATQGNIKMAADSLDLTSYYDLFGASSKSTASQPAAPSAPPAQTTPAAAGPEQEPPAKTLPFRNFTAEATIGRLYLHEIQITNLQMVTKLQSTAVSLNPCKLALNGAPVDTTLDLDTSVPGYKYAFAFNANAVPLAPLVNTFEPARKGVLSGTFTAVTKISGAGTTGASLRKSLQGQFDIGSTNLNLSVDNIQGNGVSTKLLRVLVDTISTIPELASNPAAGATSLLSGLLGHRGSTGSGGSLTGDLKKSPIDSIILRGNAGSGRVNLQQALIESPAFEAEATGAVTLAPVLTNSPIQIPVSVSLARSVAQRINLAGNTPTNAPYAKLPDFLTIEGTLGNPTRHINYAALAGAVAQGIGGKAGQVGGALNGLGGLLGGKGTQGNAPSTNAPATNQSPAGNLLNRFRGLIK
ncbi:MAG TPA: AsmA family protein [Verrucomicrobiae bacterium]|nr:AsmA family protein [Verrucomicrobiae bacterium]